MSEPVHFDVAYYQRFYLDPRTRIYDRRRQWHLAQAVFHFADWLGFHLERVLDVGAGVGWWGQWVRKHRPSLELTSTELDPEVCKRFGHTQADLTTWRSRDPFDLIICQGVLPYLDDVGAEAAIDNLGAMSCGLLYLEAITSHDLKHAVNPVLTDARIHKRSAAWYRARLAGWFTQIGAGLWARKNANVVLYELEQAPRSAARREG